MKRAHLSAAIGAALLAAATMGGVSAVVAADGFNEIKRTNSNPASMPASGRTSGSSYGLLGDAWGRLRKTWQRRAAYGWTNNHAKRVATKKRNVAKHRRSSR